jgi:hypothetical protein
MDEVLPWRAAGPASPPAPVDLARMPVLRDGRLRKRWRYVAVFDERLMLCAGVAQVGVAVQAFWAVWDRERGVLRERTRLLRGRRHVGLRAGSVAIRDGDVAVDLRIGADGPPVQTASPAGRAWTWTRKQGTARFAGRARIGAETVALDAPGCVDESAGYHDRRTAWTWSAGAGTLEDGRPVGWSLVAGLHDAPAASERSLWVAGAVSEPGPVAFAPGLDAIAFASGERLRFAAEATRSRRDDLGLVRSDYVQPFGTFAGELPGGLRLARGLGVMERHAALW